jgi:ABC-type phosphate transport system substrate-binding protein
MTNARRTARRLIASAVGIASVSALLLFQMGAAQAVGEKPAQVLGSGSDAAYHMDVALGALYNGSPGCRVIANQGESQPLDFSCLSDDSSTIHTENYTHDQVSYAYPIGGGAGVKQLCQQGLQGVAHMDFAVQTSAPDGSVCTGTHYVAFARDGISWEAFPGVDGGATKNMNNKNGTCNKAGGYCLSQADLQGIFTTCTITNWSQVGGANAPIAVYTLTSAYGTRKAWDNFLGGDSSHCIPANQQATHIIPQTTDAPIFANGDEANAIFYWSYGSYQSNVAPSKDGSKLGLIDGVAINPKTIGDGSFPFGRFVYNVYCTSACSSGASSQAAVDYVGESGWICKVAGDHSNDPISGTNFQKLIAKAISSNFFVPLKLGPIGGGVPGKDYCRLFTH